MGEYKLYVLIDKNDNVHYVGITTNSLIHRFSTHVSECKNKNTKKCVWIKSMFEKGENPKIKLVSDDFINDIDLKNAEISYIDKLLNEGVKLTNSTNGGEGVKGLKHSEETKHKISVNRKGKSCGESHPYFKKGIFLDKKHSEKTKTLMSHNRVGKKKSYEHRKKLSEVKLGDKNNNYGKHFSDNHKNKLSLSNKKNHFFDNSSFTKENILNIRKLYEENYTIHDILKIYDKSSYRKIRDIVNRITFKDLQ